MKELVCLSVFIILAALFAIAMVIAGFICQYKHKTPVKNSIYECGMQPVSDARIQFDIKYFHYAVIFLIFDIELGLFAVIEAFIFAGLLLFGLYYAIGRKVLKWG